jgi:glucose-6-phosphate isomerase
VGLGVFKEITAACRLAIKNVERADMHQAFSDSMPRNAGRVNTTEMFRKIKTFSLNAGIGGSLLGSRRAP